MRFFIENLDVFFPYDYVYKEQYDYMLNLKHALDAKGHAMLEMPTGTGKTVCLLSLVTSYKSQFPRTGKLIYCTRTVPEMIKCMDEIKNVTDYRRKVLGEQDHQGQGQGQDGGKGKVLAVCLSARRNLCVHQGAMSEADNESVDSKCRSMTAPWVRNKAKSMGAAGGEYELCDFFEKFEAEGTNAEIPHGVYSLDDMKELGRQRGWCPYFMARYLISHADIIVYNYQYMLDPKVSSLVSKELEKESIVVFDEAHNIDNVCIEALSVTLDTKTIEASVRSVHRLRAKVAEMKASDSQRLQREYRDLLSGLIEQGAIPNRAVGGANNPDQAGRSVAALADLGLASAVIPQDVLDEAVPGSIRKAEHFVQFLKNIVVYLKTIITRGQQLDTRTPLNFLHDLQKDTALERKPLRFTYSRLNSLLRTLEVTALDEFNALTDVAQFVTLVATYMEGFSIIFDPQGVNQLATNVIRGLYEPVLQLTCLDASIAIKPVFERFQSVIITSGTLSPMNFYPKILNFSPQVSVTLPMNVFRPCLLPLIVTRGSDQLSISTNFNDRNDMSIVRNYGNLVVELCKNVPDGICVFFPSYLYMENIIQKWEGINILTDILKHKLIFLETKDVVETTLALENFKRACDSGKGAVFFSISRGKVAEGVDFDRHYGRAVVIIGVPYQYAHSQTLIARMEFMQEKYQIRREDFYTFDALRQTAQCIGRVIRSKTDYGAVILADSRFNKSDKRTKFPPWVIQFMGDHSLNLSVDVAVEQVKSFLRTMGQPVDQAAHMSILLDKEKVEALNRHYRRPAGLDAVVQNHGTAGQSSSEAPVVVDLDESVREREGAGEGQPVAKRGRFDVSIAPTDAPRHELLQTGDFDQPVTTMDSLAAQLEELRARRAAARPPVKHNDIFLMT